MKAIQLTKGYVAFVDDEDFERVNQFKWYASVSARSVYARRSIHISTTKCITQRLHHFVLNDTVKVDHKDHNGLNNQKHNLRPATHSDNTHNSRLYINNTSGYKGVCWDKLNQKWTAHITVNAVQTTLGYFTSKEAAARVYDAAAVILHKRFCCTNVMLGLLPPLEGLANTTNEMMEAA